jgi:hypothetical protein
MSPTQIENLQVGDLVKFGASIRKVRRISSNFNHDRARVKVRVHMVYFAILRRSWTNRPYTLYAHHELRAGHIKLVRRGVRLRTTKNERLVQKEIDARHHTERFITADRMVGTVI